MQVQKKKRIKDQYINMTAIEFERDVAQGVEMVWDGFSVWDSRSGGGVDVKLTSSQGVLLEWFEEATQMLCSVIQPREDSMNKRHNTEDENHPDP